MAQGLTRKRARRGAAATPRQASVAALHACTASAAGGHQGASGQATLDGLLQSSLPVSPQGCAGEASVATSRLKASTPVPGSGSAARQGRLGLGCAGFRHHLAGAVADLGDARGHRLGRHVGG